MVIWIQMVPLPLYDFHGSKSEESIRRLAVKTQVIDPADYYLGAYLDSVGYLNIIKNIKNFFTVPRRTMCQMWFFVLNIFK